MWMVTVFSLSKEVVGVRSKGNLRSNFIIQRMVGMWHNLPEEVVVMGTIATLKSCKQVHRKGLEGYMTTAGK